MTLLASERSLFIRNKFRSVLQLRIQNRRLSEINADSGIKSTCLTSKVDKDQSEAQRLLDDSTSQKLPPGGQNAETTQELIVCSTQRQKKAHPTQDLNKRIQHPSGALEQQYEAIYPASIALSADVLEDDIPSSSSSDTSPTKRCGAHQQLAFPSLPGLPSDLLLRDCSTGGPSINSSPCLAQSGLAMLSVTKSIRQPARPTLADGNNLTNSTRTQGLYVTSHTHPQLPKAAQPPSPPCNSSLAQTFNFNHLPRPRKPRDTKPKMRKLKYHQYIPPDQKTGSVTGGGGAKQKSPNSTQLSDPVISQPLKQQQIFLQLQIIQNQQQQQQKQQQQLTVVSSGKNSDLVKSAGEIPVNLHPVPSTTNVSLMDSPSADKQEVLPANLADLTVSELRLQLRKRGLPVSGTKPALLQRLRPFQFPHACLSPVPLSHFGSSPETLTPCPQLQPNHSPASSSTSALDSPNHSPSQQLYIQDGGIPNGALTIAPNGFPGAGSVCVDGKQCNLTKTLFLAPASTASGTPSPSLPMSSFSPLQCGTPWRTESEQQELEMRERKRSRPRDRATHTNTELLGGSLHPFLQQDPGCLRRKLETDAQTEVLFTEVFCCQPCDIISNDFELPVQITASPVESLPGIRSLEEELQEAIQKAQMDPRQSIDEILDDSLTSTALNDVSDQKTSSHFTSDPSPPPLQSELPQASLPHVKEEQFLPSPLCSSLLLELPPSPAIIHPNQVIPAPPPPITCTSPLLSLRKSRKRRTPSSFDAAEWLETLTSGLRPLTPPTAPFVESDFSLDSDLNVNRVLDLMIEQW